jgi:hypothetical protein
MSAASDPATDPDPDREPALVFDRHLVLEQLGGWRGMVDTTLPTVAFIVGNSIDGLWAGIWAALGCALLIFVLRLVRRESVQQTVSGLFGVGIAVAIAAASGQARNFFAFGILRNAVIGVVLLASIPLRRPLVGVVAEFLAPSHLGAMASHRLPGLRRRTEAPAPADTAGRDPEPEPELPWRDDPRLVRAYGWLTVLWGVTFLVRVLVQGLLYEANEVTLLATAGLVLGLPVTAAEILVTLWVVSRLHRHRRPDVADPDPSGT